MKEYEVNVKYKLTIPMKIRAESAEDAIELAKEADPDMNKFENLNATEVVIVSGNEDDAKEIERQNHTISKQEESELKELVGKVSAYCAEHGISLLANCSDLWALKAPHGFDLTEDSAGHDPETFTCISEDCIATTFDSSYDFIFFNN